MLDRAGRADLARRIQANPGQFVAQEQVALSTAPVRTEYGVAPRHVVVRVFAAWDGESYSVLPGGLTRVSTADKSLVVSMQQGGGSKDTWVLVSEKDAETTGVGVQPGPTGESRGAAGESRGAAGESSDQRAAAFATAVHPRGAGELPSRAADNLFWLGRYTERVEDNVRLVRTLLPGLSGEADFGRSASLGTVTQLLSNMGYLAEEFPSSSIAQQRWQLQRLLTGMVYNPSRSTGIGWNLKQIRRVAWPLKERLSQDTWRVLQQLDMEFSDTGSPGQSGQTFITEINLLDRAIVTLSAFAGLLMENTTRGYGWRFLEIGRRLERALQTCNLLDAALARTELKEDSGEAESGMEVLLQIADSSITYRTRHLTEIRADYVLELLLADEANPRSVAFQLVELLEHIQHLPCRDTDDSASSEHRLISKALGSVRQAWMSDLARCDDEGKLNTLGELTQQLRATLYDFSEALTSRYLSHLSQSRLHSS